MPPGLGSSREGDTRPGKTPKVNIETPSARSVGSCGSAADNGPANPHDARSHNDRRIALRVRLGQPPADPDPDATWVNTRRRTWPPKRWRLPVRFGSALDDLRCLVSGAPSMPPLVARVEDEHSEREILHRIANAAATPCGTNLEFLPPGILAP